jgi:octaprenyl-diphosphate synthase
VTLPLIYALENGSPEERMAVATILKDRSYDKVPFRHVLSLIERHQGFDRAKERASAFTTKAREIIGSFPESPYQRALYAVTDLVTDRDH